MLDRVLAIAGPIPDPDSLEHRDPDLLIRVTALIAPALEAWFRPVVRGLERVPDGAALYVGNHSGATTTPDTFVFCGHLLRERGVEFVPWGLAHELALIVPGFRHILLPLGAVRASHENALRLLRAGEKVMVYPGGDLDAMRAWRDRKRVVFGPRRGYVRLAIQAGVPIVPVVTAGGHEIFRVLSDGRRIAHWIGADRFLRLKCWPIILSVPWGLTVGPPPPCIPWRTRIFQEVLDPIEFERTGDEAAADSAYVETCHNRVLSAMQDALTRLYAERDAAQRSSAPG